VVVKLGDLDVNDMMGYMKALAAFEKGATAPIVVLRDGKEHRTEVTF
jgi:S1-C subfamily serine protease